MTHIVTRRSTSVLLSSYKAKNHLRGRLEKRFQIYAKNLSHVLPNVTPTAQAILQLAAPTFRAGNAKPASEAAPIYIRNRVALTTSEREQGQRL